MAAVAKREDLVAELDALIQSNNLPALAQQGAFERTFAVARAVQRLRELLTDDMLADVMALQGSALGFRTDRDAQGGYERKVVREVLIEATLRGFYMVGNEVNIIGGRFYGTKEGYTRKLAEYDGLTALKERVGVPKAVGDKGALVMVGASWNLHGVAAELPDQEIPIRVNAGMGADAIIGKAKRKLRAAIYERLTGSPQPEGEVEDAIETTARPVEEQAAAGTQRKLERLKERYGNSPEHSDEDPGPP